MILNLNNELICAMISTKYCTALPPGPVTKGIMGRLYSLVASAGDIGIMVGSSEYNAHSATVMLVTSDINTVGADKNGTLVFVNFSAQDASILKISVPIIKRRS